MLHDPSHTSVNPELENMNLSEKETLTLQKLGEEIQKISSLPIQKEKASLWTNMNDLQSKRPMLWITELPWHELDHHEDLVLTCKNPWARQLEQQLRQTIYQWRNLPGDMVVSDFISCPFVYHSSDFGIMEQVESAHTDSDNNIYSRHFIKQIDSFEDIEKIKLPVITPYPDITKAVKSKMDGIFKDIIPVKVEKQSHIWYTPWDYLVRWWGVEDAMIDLMERPELVHAAYEKMVGAWMSELDQFEAMNLLELDCNNTRIGSGGYGYTTQLPGNDFDPDHVKAKNMWGCSNAQILSSVSPDMHWEFALEHDLKWLERWGMTYYGCCEPLDSKIHLLRRIPNLRKISVSPWCNYERIVGDIGKDYVMSYKPNPAIFVPDYNPDLAEKDLRHFLELAKGCHIEVILKDISTVCYKPEGLWQWEKMAMKVIEEYI